MDEKIYTINIRKAIAKVPRWEKSKRSVAAVKNYLKKHMKSDEVRIGKSITEEIWKGGNQNPPKSIRIHAILTEDEDKGKMIIQSIVLDETGKRNKLKNSFLKLKMIIDKEAELTLKLTWCIYDFFGKIITQGGDTFKGQTYHTIPKTYALYQNYPNPFNPVTNIKYDLPIQSDVKLIVYDLLGRKVRTLVNRHQLPGQKIADWGALDDHGHKVASGLYIYKLIAGKYVKSRKMLLMK